MIPWILIGGYHVLSKSLWDRMSKRSKNSWYFVVSHMIDVWLFEYVYCWSTQLYCWLLMIRSSRGFVSPYWFVYCWPSCPESPLCDVYVSCFPCSVPHDINSPGDGDVCCSAIPPISPGGLRNVGRVTNKGSLIIWSWQTTINLPGIIYTHIHTYVQT